MNPEVRFLYILIIDVSVWGLIFLWFIILPYCILSVISEQVKQVMSALADFSYDDCFTIMPDADGAIPQVDSTLSDGHPTEAIKKTTSLCNSNMKEAGKGAVSCTSVKETHQK